MKTINQLTNELNVIRAKLDLDSKFDHLFEINTYPTHQGAMFLELENDQYHLVWSERGTEINRISTKESSEVLFHHTSQAINQIVTSTSYGNPRPDISRQLELMRKVDLEWAERVKADFLKYFPDEEDDCI